MVSARFQYFLYSSSSMFNVQYRKYCSGISNSSRLQRSTPQLTNTLQKKLKEFGEERNLSNNTSKKSKVLFGLFGHRLSQNLSVIVCNSVSPLFC